MPKDSAAVLLKAADLVRSEALLRAAELVKTSENVLIRLAVVETKITSLISFQKWQMGALAAILAAVIGAWVSR